MRAQMKIVGSLCTLAAIACVLLAVLMHQNYQIMSVAIAGGLYFAAGAYSSFFKPESWKYLTLDRSPGPYVDLRDLIRRRGTLIGASFNVAAVMISGAAIALLGPEHILLALILAAPLFLLAMGCFLWVIFLRMRTPPSKE